ncbi:MAG TPA: 2-dehydropantoate 2-reductase [Deltaproteobacteria bacterium]|nr:2-dehydropantoate 2-reductase [Deltaproteobacteria bacterium]
MRIGIIGIGGVGGYFGGKLAREYGQSGQHEIIFIARGEHFKTIQQKGLQLFTREGDYVAKPAFVTDDSSEAGVFDLILFCTKSYALENAAGSFKENVCDKTVVIPLLNGVNSAQRLRAIMPQADIVSGSVYIISHLEKPGIIKQEGGACRLTFGTDDYKSAQKYSYILDILLNGKINAVLTDKISETLWNKFLLMCPVGSLTAATGKTYGQIWEDPVMRKKARNMMLEVVAVARARNINLEIASVEKAMKMIPSFGYNSKTSMQMDKEKGRQTEIDALTAYLCRAGKESGVPTPLHDEIYQRL